MLVPLECTKMVGAIQSWERCEVSPVLSCSLVSVEIAIIWPFLSLKQSELSWANWLFCCEFCQRFDDNVLVLQDGLYRQDSKSEEEELCASLSKNSFTSPLDLLEYGISPGFKHSWHKYCIIGTRVNEMALMWVWGPPKMLRSYLCSAGQYLRRPWKILTFYLLFHVFSPNLIFEILHTSWQFCFSLRVGTWLCFSTQRTALRLLCLFGLNLKQNISPSPSFHQEFDWIRQLVEWKHEFSFSAIKIGISSQSRNADTFV